MRGLSNIAESLIKENKVNPAISDIFIKWDQIVGDDLAQSIEPHKIVKMNNSNILVVKSKNCCAIEIQHNSMQVIDKLNNYFQAPLFSVIRVISE